MSSLVLAQSDGKLSKFFCFKLKEHTVFKWFSKIAQECYHIIQSGQSNIAIFFSHPVTLVQFTFDIFNNLRKN